jgi:hypothetical protein
MKFLGFLGILYAITAYCCFWVVLKKTEPGIPYAILLPLLALIVGPPIFAFALARVILDPRYRPVHVTFIEIDISGEPGQRPYRTLWSSDADIGEIVNS